jgi:hypothetical protein
MGCCQSIAKVESSLLKNQTDLDKLPKDEAIQTLKHSVSQSVKDFENALHIKITPKRPLSLSEFEQTIKYSIQSELQRFDLKFFKIPENLEILAEYKKYRSYLLSKCSSKEGYFRNLNDFYSSELVSTLSSEIIQEFFDGKFEFQDALNKYQRLARGSYVISGLQNLHGFLQMESSHQALEKLRLEMDEVEKVLEINKKELERASNKALLPLDSENDYVNPFSTPRNQSAAVPSRVPYNPEISVKKMKVFVYEELTSKSNETGHETSLLKI